MIAPAGDVSDDNESTNSGDSESEGEDEDDGDEIMGFSVKDMISMRRAMEQEEEEISEDETDAAGEAQAEDRAATLRDDPDGAMFVRPGQKPPMGGVDWMSGLDSDSDGDDGD